MRAIGFRVEPTMVHYAVVEGKTKSPTVVDTKKLKAPLAYTEGEQLVWYRKAILAALDEYKPDRVGIRFPETGTKGAGTVAAMRRLRIEGVTMEAACSMSLPIPAAGGNKHIQAKLGATHSAKEYTTGQVELRGIQLSDYPENMRHAIIIGVSALAEDD